MVKEDFCSFVWQYKRFYTRDLISTDGESVEVLRVGTKNDDSGPDFFNAKIKIGKTTWAGNVEIHVLSSDWQRHKHQHDKAYDNVILHVVYKADKDVFNSKGRKIPQLELTPYLDSGLISKYENLLHSKSNIACSSLVKDAISPSEWVIWLQNTAAKRIETKVLDIEQLYQAFEKDSEQTLFALLLKNFGFKVNGDAFLLLSKHLPYKIIKKHKGNLLQIEALLFGAAGMLHEEAKDEYFSQLKKEWTFLKGKYSLSEIEKHLWRFSKTRPVNFPTVRLAQLSSLLNRIGLLENWMEQSDKKTFLKELSIINPSEYWETHYQFSQPSKKKSKHIGEQTSSLLLINTIAPWLFFLSNKKRGSGYKERAISLLESVKPEQNFVVKSWENIGFRASNALDTQGLIELNKNYCSPKKCLSCTLGVKMIGVNK